MFTIYVIYAKGGWNSGAQGKIEFKICSRERKVVLSYYLRLGARTQFLHEFGGYLRQDRQLICLECEVRRPIFWVDLRCLHQKRTLIMHREEQNARSSMLQVYKLGVPKGRKEGRSDRERQNCDILFVFSTFLPRILAHVGITIVGRGDWFWLSAR